MILVFKKLEEKEAYYFRLFISNPIQTLLNKSLWGRLRNLGQTSQSVVTRTWSLIYSEFPTSVFKEQPVQVLWLACHVPPALYSPCCLCAWPLIFFCFAWSFILQALFSNSFTILFTIFQEVDLFCSWSLILMQHCLMLLWAIVWREGPFETLR